MFFVSLLALGTTIGVPMSSSIQVVNLRCEFLENPLSIEDPNPRLSWNVESSTRGARQSAYRIIVSSSRERAESGAGDLWDSGKVSSDNTISIRYAGNPLPRLSSAFWRVKAWDQKGQESDWSSVAQFRTGVRHESDWRGEWIRDEQIAPSGQPPHNGFHTELASSPGAEKWVTLDLGKPQRISEIRLHPARPFDWIRDEPGFLFPVRFVLEAADASDFSKRTLLHDATAEDFEAPNSERRFTFSPVTARFVRLRVTKLRERDPGNFGFALAEMQALGPEGAVVSKSCEVTASDSIESHSWSKQRLVDGDLTSHRAKDRGPLPATYFRRGFELNGKVKEAYLHSTALGVYEPRLNGSRIGDSLLAPEWTDYSTRVQVQTWDVTPLVREGNNVLGFEVGDGWYCGRIGMAQSLGTTGLPREVYGRQHAVRAMLEVRFADGREAWIGTDGSWRTTTQGPIRASDILDGEVYDANFEMPGWDAPGFDDRSWGSAHIAERISANTVPQVNEPISVVERIPAVSVQRLDDGAVLVDFGQNIAGVLEARLRGSKGLRVAIRHGEAIADDGSLYTANLRGAAQMDTVIFGDSKELTFRPKFTYHGFRYASIEGLDYTPSPSDFVALVQASSSPETADFECSNPLLNKLWDNILRTQRANLQSVPTDCPQRDERLGWMGDILAYGQTAVFRMDLAAFFDKWFQDVRDAQADDGRYPDFAPHPFGKNRSFTGAPAWGDAGVFVPWIAYQNYGDVGFLADHFESARRWVDWIRSKNSDLVWRNGRHNDYNDWLNGDTLIAPGWPRTGATIPNEVFATAFFAESCRLVAEMARALGREKEASDYAGLHRQIRSKFAQEFINEDGVVKGDTQAGYAIALDFDLVPPELRDKAVENLRRSLAAYGDHLSTGFHSTHRMMIQLSKLGMHELACKLATQTTFPGWGYSLENGATSIWERWDGYVKGRGFQDPGMNSLNHWAFGAIGEWMMRCLVGINPVDDSPGWKRFVIRPMPGGGISSCRGSYRSVRGKIECSWVVLPEGLAVSVTVPANTTAALALPATFGDVVLESGRDPASALGVKPLGKRADEHRFELESGTYTFTVRER